MNETTESDPRDGKNFKGVVASEIGAEVKTTGKLEIRLADGGGSMVEASVYCAGVDLRSVQVGQR